MSTVAKNRYVRVIIALILLMVVGFGTCIVMFIDMSVEGITIEKGLIFIAGLMGFLLSLSAVIKQSSAYNQLRIDEVKEGKEAILIKWEIEKPQWLQFHNAKFEFDKKETTGYGWAAAGLMGVISGFSIWSRLEPAEAVVSTLLIATIFFFIGKYAAMFKAKSDFQKRGQLDVAEVYFAESSIIFNSKLILINSAGYRLKRFSIEDKFDMKVVLFTIESGIGSRKTTHDYMIPVPIERIEDVNKLFSYYSGFA
ncbi:hypothetical protein ACV07N_00265 [Roseivirga echinicomitans]